MRRIMGAERAQWLAQEGRKKAARADLGGAQNAAGRKLYTTEMEFPINFGLGGSKSSSSLSSSPSSSSDDAHEPPPLPLPALCRTELLSSLSSRAIRCSPPRGEEQNDVGGGNPGKRAAGMKLGTEGAENRGLGMRNCETHRDADT